MAATRLAAASGLHEIAWKLPAAAMSFYYRRSHWGRLGGRPMRSAWPAPGRSATGWREAWMLNNLGMAYGVQRMAGVGRLSSSRRWRSTVSWATGRRRRGRPPTWPMPTSTWAASPRRWIGRGAVARHPAAGGEPLRRGHRAWASSAVPAANWAEFDDAIEPPGAGTGHLPRTGRAGRRGGLAHRPRRGLPRPGPSGGWRPTPGQSRWRSAGHRRSRTARRPRCSGSASPIGAAGDAGKARAQLTEALALYDDLRRSCPGGRCPRRAGGDGRSTPAEVARSFPLW